MRSYAYQLVVSSYCQLFITASRHFWCDYVIIITELTENYGNLDFFHCLLPLFCAVFGLVHSMLSHLNTLWPFILCYKHQCYWKSEKLDHLCESVEGMFTYKFIFC